jgi:hypothetical protein
MLNPKKNRIDYGVQLIPPEGYEFTYAVGTTYSLDLEALMILPVALFYSQLLDASADKMRYDILDSITKASDKIVIYCQKGKIHVPRNYQNLLAYWEKGIEEITMSHKAQSFHPKVWVIRYEASDMQPKYRILVTSRNLTFSRDWDVAFSSEGEVGSGKVKRTEPLIHFLQHIESRGKREFPKEFIKDLAKVDFDVPKGFRFINFLPIGIVNPDNSEYYQNPLSKKYWNDLLVMSPFVQDQSINNLWENTYRKLWVLSRKEELDTLSNATLEELDAYQFSETIQGAESDESISEEGDIPRTQNFHAKLFIGLRNGNPFWYLGSANASNPAFGRNIEFMVELKGDGYKQYPRTILNLLTSEKKEEVVLFEPYQLKNKVNQGIRKINEIIIRDIIYALTKIAIHGFANLNDGIGLYDLLLEVDARKLKLPGGYSIRLLPLPATDRKSVVINSGEKNIVKDFTGFTETQLSPFIIWEIYNSNELQKKFIVQMLIELPDTRLNKIFTSIINSREKFYKYITFLLTGDDTALLSDTQKVNKFSQNVISTKWEIPGIPVFEKLMIAASRYPNRLQYIDDLIRKIKSEDSENDENIITPEFASFWNTFITYWRQNLER